MAADQYCLKWNNHQSTLLVQFETLLESDSLTDCTLSAEGKYLNVHKVLLSACSPYFSKLLGEHKDKHPIFFMKDVAFEELKGIVEYMYKGEVNVMQERLDSFLKTASSLQIKGLADQDGGKGEDREEDPGGGRAKRKQAPDLRGGYGESSPMPEEPPRSPKRRRRPRPVSQDDSLPAQDQNHCDTTTAPAFSQLQQQEVVMPTPLVPVKKTEPVDNSMVHLKTEIPDDVPQVDVQDLTLDDDEDFNNEDITQPGTSFSETSQDFAQWQQQMATQSGADESFMAATQGINQSGSQGVGQTSTEVNKWTYRSKTSPSQWSLTSSNHSSAKEVSNTFPNPRWSTKATDVTSPTSEMVAKSVGFRSISSDGDNSATWNNSFTPFRNSSVNAGFPCQESPGGSSSNWIEANTFPNSAIGPLSTNLTSNVKNESLEMNSWCQRERTGSKHLQWPQTMSYQSPVKNGNIGSHWSVNQSNPISNDITSPTDDKPHKCVNCGNAYKLKTSLRNHVKYECGKEKNLLCPHCPYRAKLKGHLKIHIIGKHASVGM